MNICNKLTVIVPTCHRNDLLAKCLDCLAPGKQTLSPSCYEVIVTDDGSQSTAKEMLEEYYPWAKWVKGPQKGPAANRNNGAKHAKGEWLVFTDDDCLPEPVWLETYFKSIKQYPTVKAFEGAIHPTSWKELKKDLAECPINIQGNCFWSANIAIEGKLYWNIGGFDEEFLVAAQEDQDIFLRLGKCTEILFLENCIVTHPIRSMSLIKSIKDIPIRCKNWLLYALKNKRSLFITNYFSLIRNGFSIHLVQLKKSTKKLYLKQLILSLTYLTVGFSVVTWYYFQSKVTFNKNDEKTL